MGFLPTSRSAVLRLNTAVSFPCSVVRPGALPHSLRPETPQPTPGASGHHVLRKDRPRSTHGKALKALPATPQLLGPHSGHRLSRQSPTQNNTHYTTKCRWWLKSDTFSICACHPCAGAMLIFSVSFQFFRIPLRREVQVSGSAGWGWVGEGWGLR